MKGPKPPTVNLSEAEQQGLEKLVKAHSTPHRLCCGPASSWRPVKA